MCVRAFRLAIFPCLVWPQVASYSPLQCTDAASCDAKLQQLVEELRVSQNRMAQTMQNTDVVADFRSKVLHNRRPALATAARQQFSSQLPVLTDVTSDSRYPAVSRDFGRHFHGLRTVAPNKVVVQHILVPLKDRQISGGHVVRSRLPHCLVLIVDDESRLSVYSPDDGSPALVDFDLSHPAGSVVKGLYLSPGEGRFIVTFDDFGEVRVHTLKIIANTTVITNRSKAKPRVEIKLAAAPQLQGSFVVPPPNTSSKAVARLTSLVPVQKRSDIYIVTGDTLGYLSIFSVVGKLAASQHVTEVVGGVIGLRLMSSGTWVVFYTTHSFGYFNVQSVDVPYPECVGWRSPLASLAVDALGQYSRPLLALADGDILVYASKRGKTKGCCEVRHKLPRLLHYPSQLYHFGEHMLALEQAQSAASNASVCRDLYLFDLTAVETGYFVAPSNLVMLHVTFPGRCPVAFTTFGLEGRSIALVALRFANRERGVDVYDFQPTL